MNFYLCCIHGYTSMLIKQQHPHYLLFFSLFLSILFIFNFLVVYLEFTYFLFPTFVLRLIQVWLCERVLFRSSTPLTVSMLLTSDCGLQETTFGIPGSITFGNFDFANIEFKKMFPVIIRIFFSLYRPAAQQTYCRCMWSKRRGKGSNYVCNDQFPYSDFKYIYPFFKAFKKVFTCEMKIKILISTEATSPSILCLRSKSNDSRQLNQLQK